MVCWHKWEYSNKIAKGMKKPESRYCPKCRRTEKGVSLVKGNLLFEIYVDVDREPIPRDTMERKSKIYSRLGMIMCVLTFGCFLYLAIEEITINNTMMYIFPFYALLFLIILNKGWRYGFEEEAYHKLTPKAYGGKYT